ncbi:MAG: hypothetical protein LBI06_01065 [Treponema sp.]|jgi:adenylate cyclase|nr:hypothetical protein [Treponema sp.]
MKVRLSIGTRLISIIAIIALVSLGFITGLVSWLVRQDLQAAAEDANFAINRHTSAEAEAVISNVRSNSQSLIRTIAAAGTGNAFSQNAVQSFFEEHPQIAAIFFTAEAQKDGIVVSSRFFRSREIDEALAGSYRDEYAINLRRAEAGETLLLNAAPHFAVPVLALFFPWQGGGAGVLFSPEQLDDAFSFGANRSYLINDSGDILIHADFELVRDGANVADSDFARYVWDSQERNSRTLYSGEDGTRYFMAFAKLNTGGCTVITGIEYGRVFEGIAVALRCNIYLSVAILLISIIVIWFFARGREQK